MSVHVLYPVRVEATLDPQLSRWMWLVKWFLAIPHFVVLAMLWVAYCLLTVVAFFGILFTGRYPKGIFAFNSGVLRWSWRVSYYALGAMGTDQYPPFTLRDVPGYPAHFEVAYPEHLSRGLVLVKWWLLAIPHYIIVGILMGGTWFAWSNEDWRGSSVGLIGILAFFAVVTLAFTGRYPRGLFDLILGFNRWVLRVAAYAGLMTDEYPPFRLDTGGSESGPSVAVPMEGSPASTAKGGWTPWRVTSLVIGVLLSFVALGIGGAGGVGLWADTTQRDGTGFLVTSSEHFATDTHALLTDEINVDLDGPDQLFTDEILGDARLRITPSRADQSIFIGMAESADVRRYLAGVSYATTTDFLDEVQVAQDGGAPSTAPGEQDFWVRSSEGEGMQAIKWRVGDGDWMVVAMNSDGSKDISIDADIGVEAPALTGIAVGLIVVGVLLLLLAVGLVAGAAHRASRRAPGDDGSIARRPSG